MNKFSKVIDSKNLSGGSILNFLVKFNPIGNKPIKFIYILQ